MGDWGINFGRIIRSNSETAYWSGHLSEDFRLSQGGTLTGFELQHSKMQLTLLPYINLTRYELSYPEKRVFFQEGNEMYNTRIKTFYSRRIQDIDFGTRVNGKMGKTQFNVLSVKSPEVLPDSTPAFFTAARVKYDLLKSSTVGFTLVSKDEPGY